MVSLNFNNTISERDMDLLFAESILTDPDFCQLLINKTDLKEKPFQVLSVELSKADSKLGESDITVTIDVKRKKYALLIEDKIDEIYQLIKQDKLDIVRGIIVTDTLSWVLGEDYLDVDPYVLEESGEEK